MIVYALKISLNILLIVHWGSLFGSPYGHMAEVGVGGGTGCGVEGGGRGVILGIVI